MNTVMVENTHSCAGKPAHGFPHLSAVKESIKLLYQQLSPQRVKSFSKSLPSSETVMTNKGSIIIGVQTLAGAIVRHLQLPTACIVVNFREMDNPGRVELTPEDEYLVDLNNKYRNDPRDIAAVLAHEVTHVFLHRNGIRFPDTFENEILTDTAAVYLGVGWLCLNAYRVFVNREERSIGHDMREVRTTATEERLGYLTPEEFGYVLRKRSLAFREAADHLITSPPARSALLEGAELAIIDHRSAPVVGCNWRRRLEYYWNRWRICKAHRDSGLTGISHEFRGYRFEVSDSTRVIFECPVCSQRLRLPTKKRTFARCSVCETSFECGT